MPSLHHEDLKACLKKIPSKLKDIIKSKSPGSVFIAGGFIRSVIMHEAIHDIDVFARDSDLSKSVANLYSNTFTPPARIMETKNAITIPTKKPVVQVISRWHFSEPRHVIDSFDFVHCCAVIWYDGDWVSECHEHYYRDLAGKHLTYTAPTRMEDPGGSMVRVLKFMRRGFRIDAENLGLVMARVSDASEKALDAEEDIDSNAFGVDFGGGLTGRKKRTEKIRGASIAKLMKDVYPRNGV